MAQQPAPDLAGQATLRQLTPREREVLASQLARLKTLDDVQRFADRIGIAPGIVVGRLQHDNLWPYSQGNQLKRQLSFPPPTDE